MLIVELTLKIKTVQFKLVYAQLGYFKRSYATYITCSTKYLASNKRPKISLVYVRHT